MRRKILIAIFALVIVLFAAPLASAVPWIYPKNNDKFEEFGVTFGFDWTPLIMANYAATAGLTEANKVVVTYNELATSYQIRIGETGPDQRIYNLYDPTTQTGDFTYSGVNQIVTWDPALPYAFDPNNILGTLFVPGDKTHLRVDYLYDFSAVPGGLDGTITMVALVTGNGVFLIEDVKEMYITSVTGIGDFSGVNIKAYSTTLGHIGLVSGWPE